MHGIGQRYVDAHEASLVTISLCFTFIYLKNVCASMRLRVLFIGLVFISRDRAQKIVEVTLNFLVSPVMARAFPLMASYFPLSLFVSQVGVCVAFHDH